MKIKAFIKRILGNDDADIYYESVLKPEKKQDIGEPVIAFLRIFEATPKRFKLTKKATKPGRTLYFSEYTFKDKVSGDSWVVKLYGVHYEVLKPLNCPDLDWMTSDEQYAVLKAVSAHFQKRMFVGQERKNRNYQRKLKNERDRLMGVYQ